MRILITGAPGWLGNRFLEILVKGWDQKAPLNDWALRCLVLPNVNTAIFHELSKIKNIECVEGDVRRPETLRQAVKDVDVVYHIAGIIHPRRIKELYDVNTSGTDNLLRACLNAHVKRIVYVSSNSAAGINASPEILLQEQDAPKPYMNYGWSKRLSEQILQRASGSGKIETVILRPCWYYGPNQPPRQTTFFRMIQKGRPIIFGDGSALRSMSYVDNTCQALLLSAEQSRAIGQIYWIADAHPYAANEIYATVAKLLNVQDYKPLHVPNLVSEVCLVADRMLQGVGLYIKEIHVAGEMNKDIACSIEKARNELGYNPTIGLEEGMRRSIDWCRGHGIDI